MKKCCEKHLKYAKCLKFIENEKYYTVGETINLQNISPI